MLLSATAVPFAIGPVAFLASVALPTSVDGDSVALLPATVPFVDGDGVVALHGCSAEKASVLLSATAVPFAIGPVAFLASVELPGLSFMVLQLWHRS